ncbi:MAG: DHH family phosphoesterase [Candidatus Heimdallarchaeaceae archaeon]|jgi:nanoRNase/pAp phosphatase (c-di-AMP/oligoRNAs hydrolase)
MSEEFSKIIHILKQNRLKNVGIFTHQNADPDAVASVVSLKYLIEQLVTDVSVKLYIKSSNTLSKNLFSFREEEIHEDFSNQDLDAFFLCDANNLNQIGFSDLERKLEKDIPIFIIDHHSDHEFTNRARHSIILPITSTAEIMVNLFKELKISIPDDISTILIAGILFDTRRFIHLSKSTFSIVNHLIDSGGDYENALAMLQSPLSVSERIARLKGATRIRIYKDDPFIIASSYVSTFESSVARSLIELGANCSIVLSSPSIDEYRMSFRCNRNFAESKNLNLGDISNSLALHLGGSGGGHQTAAGMNFSKVKDFPEEKEKQLELIVDLFLKEIKKQ